MTNNEESLHARLARAVPNAYAKLDPYRTSARNLIREYVGPGYGGASEHQVKDRPMNLINQAVDGYMMLLAANRPRVAIQTHYPELRAFAKHFEVSLNNLLVEIGVEFTIRQWVMDAFFCIGVIKVHMAESGLVEVEPDRWMDPGSPFASNVSLDDFVFDISARKWSEVRWAGDMYRIPYEDYRANANDGVYNASAAKHRPNSKGGTSGERQEEVGKQLDTDDDELEPMIDLVDIWIPREGKIFTYVVKDRHKLNISPEPIAEMPWNGPEHGPYHILGFNDVPENIMPLPPALHFESLSKSFNNLLRKNIDAAKRQKSVNIYTPTGEGDGRRIEQARDGDWVRNDNGMDGVGTHTTPGPDGASQALMHQVLEYFDRAAGNLPSILGLGQQADTLGQEQLIHGATSRKEGQMQYRVVDATTRVIRDLGYLLWEDQIKEVAGQLTIDGTDISVPVEWKPGDRAGNFFDYNFSVVPHSMTYQPPAKDVEIVNQLLANVYGPFMQQIQAQGGAMNFAALNEFYAEALDKPILRELLSFANPTPEEQGPPQSSVKDNRPREEIRRSVGGNGGTQQGKSQARIMSLLGGANSQQQGMVQG